MGPIKPAIVSTIRLIINAFTEQKIKPYYYVRWKWTEFSKAELERISEDFSKSFSVTMIDNHEDNVSLYRNLREELRVRADTLTAFLSPFRAVIFQREAAPLTARDMKLRKKLLELYPRNRMSPLPWDFFFEPKFEVAK